MKFRGSNLLVYVMLQWILLSGSKLWCVRQTVAPHPGAWIIEAKHFDQVVQPREYDRMILSYPLFTSV